MSYISACSQAANPAASLAAAATSAAKGVLPDRGYGTEARAGVLELAFGQLGADEACTEYLDGNDAWPGGSLRSTATLASLWPPLPPR
jgi:hypothetical protein